MPKKGSKSQKGEASFVKKFGLENKAKPFRTSKKVTIVKEVLSAGSEAMIKSGKAVAALDNTKYKKS